MHDKVIPKITLSGLAGSGKSTVGRLLAKKLNYEYLSIGEYSRQYAQAYFNVGINEFQLICKQSPELDRQLDQSFIEACQNAEKAVIDYRLGFHLIKNAFHVFLSVSDEAAAKRIEASGRQNENAESIRKRNREMNERFCKIYKADFTDFGNYDLVIETDKLNPEQVVNQIMDVVLIRNSA